MNYLQLPDVIRISGPEEYPYSRAKVKVGEQWYLLVSGQGSILLIGMPFRISPFTNAVEWSTMVIAYYCDTCHTKFLAHDHEGYIHECCEVQ